MRLSFLESSERGLQSTEQRINNIFAKAREVNRTFTFWY